MAAQRAVSPLKNLPSAKKSGIEMKPDFLRPTPYSFICGLYSGTYSKIKRFKSLLLRLSAVAKISSITP